MSEDAFRTALGDAAKSISEVGPIDPKRWNEFASNLHYSPGDYANPEAFTKLAKRLAELDSSKNIGGNRLFYLSTPPEVYPDIVEQLGRAGLARPSSPNSWVHIIDRKSTRLNSSHSQISYAVFCLKKKKKKHKHGR